MEIVWTGIGTLVSGDMRLMGYTNLWMFLIYGCAVFLEPINDLMEEWAWPVRGILWVVIIWGIEYTTGLIISSIIGARPWTYYGPYAVEGLIRLDYAPAWFIAGLIFERIHHALDSHEIV